MRGLRAMMPPLPMSSLTPMDPLFILQQGLKTNERALKVEGGSCSSPGNALSYHSSYRYRATRIYQKFQTQLREYRKGHRSLKADSGFLHSRSPRRNPDGHGHQDIPHESPRHPTGQNCKKIGPDSDIAPLPFVENGKAAKFDKYRFVPRLHSLSGCRKIQLDRTDGLVPGPGK